MTGAATPKGVSDRITKKDIEGWVESLSYAILRVSHGTQTGPTGLEMLAMSIAGEGLRAPVGQTVGDLSASLDCLSTATRESLGDLPGVVEDLAKSVDNHASQMEQGFDALAKAISQVAIALGYKEGE